jgi:hypothetical protein
MAQMEKNSALVAKVAEGYAAQTAIRALVQTIPYVGGPIDTLFAGKGQKIQQARVERFLTELDERVRALPTVHGSIPEDQLLDLMIGVLDKVVRTRSEEKWGRFAQIVTHQIEQGGAVDDAETATRIVSELEDIHIQVLFEAICAPLLFQLFDGQRIVTISEKPIATPSGATSLQLQKAFPLVPLMTLRLVCSELVAKGLLRDEGVGRWDLRGMEYFAPTDLAGWLFRWIAKSSRK